ncbi:hypothetical protein [Chelatococcus reniformis]|uniref:Uncharacterized protein n=1 Tax=Chelatococcus reniformis TaxID=1494448 RepID=A0A916UYM5_9HYPH|nr:hypothetical protein [Chelatococcus reniformis]GGC93264.1 hypothetical protein GCM10010994_58860 [Chelatococcus reniformis]
MKYKIARIAAVKAAKKPSENSVLSNFCFPFRQRRVLVPALQPSAHTPLEIHMQFIGLATKLADIDLPRTGYQIGVGEDGLWPEDDHGGEELPGQSRPVAG